MKIKTPSQFAKALGDEYSWRHKELLDYRLATRVTNLVAQRAMIRAGVPLAYAHWEGFIKCSTEILLNFVCHQNLRNSDLSDTYFAHSVKSQTLQFIESKRACAVEKTAGLIRDCQNLRADIRHKNYVDTESNLSSDIFEQVALSVGVNTSPYQHVYPYIDETILNSRNKIAHGEYLSHTMDEFQSLTDRVISLMYMYKTDIENLVVQKRYLKIPPAP